ECVFCCYDCTGGGPFDSLTHYRWGCEKFTGPESKDQRRTAFGSGHWPPIQTPRAKSLCLWGLGEQWGETEVLEPDRTRLTNPLNRLRKPPAPRHRKCLLAGRLKKAKDSRYFSETHCVRDLYYFLDKTDEDRHQLGVVAASGGGVERRPRHRRRT